jgi:hypothetical protein
MDFGGSVAYTVSTIQKGTFANVDAEMPSAIKPVFS